MNSVVFTERLYNILASIFLNGLTVLRVLWVVRFLLQILTYNGYIMPPEYISNSDINTSVHWLPCQQVMYF